MLSIIGVAHRAQARKRNSELTDAQRAFAFCLRRLLEQVKSKFIAEEHSTEALTELGEISIVKEIADEQGIEHRFCDPTRAERLAIGYKDGQSLQLSWFMGGEENELSPDELRLKAHATEIARYFPIRERFWLERLNGSRDSDAIFICGDGHIESFGKLLEGSRIPYRIVERGIGITAEDAWFERAKQYLSDHPELAKE
jgi:hypothetical protein